ncbi:MAG: ACP S-malonyltransferase [Polaromonas sp.]|nr:ACP S-malonyltransferase [Polaromonas sp.]
MISFAFVFPGQGSQSVGMLNGWRAHPAVLETLAEASEALGEDMGRLIEDGPADRLALTTNTQPVMLIAGVAAFRVWMAETGVAPEVVAGHSLGEYSALVAAGALTLADAAPLVRLRSQAMQDAVPVGVGAMAAILGLEAPKVIEGCAEAARSFGLNTDEVVEAVNFNDPLQTVIAGTRAAVDKACEVLKANGARRALHLAVSAPFHSTLMKPAAEALREKLVSVRISTPVLSVINNIEVAVESGPDRIRAALYRQAFGPVRWVEIIQSIRARGIDTVVESGPGKILAGMVKRIDGDMRGLALFDLVTLEELKKVMME